jgi:hypothetical protein
MDLYFIALERKLSTRKAREELVEKGILPKPPFGMDMSTLLQSQYLWNYNKFSLMKLLAG